MSYVNVVGSGGVVGFGCFDCCFGLVAGDGYWRCLEFFDFSVYDPVLSVCLMFDVIGELFVEVLCFLFVSDSYFVVIECDGCVCGWFWLFV